MTTQPDLSGHLTAIDNALSFSMSEIIEAQQYERPLDKRLIDFPCLDRAITACEELIAAHGADRLLPGGETPAMLRVRVRDVLARCEQYRPTKQREARRA